MKKMPDERRLSKRAIQADYNTACKILEKEGGAIEDSPHDYQCFTFKKDSVCIVFYPHRTSAGNYHIRVRDQGSKNKDEANRIMELLDNGAGYNCTFTKAIK